MAHPNAETIAAVLNGAVDLYAALRTLGTQGIAPIPQIIAACDATTAARLAALDAEVLAAVLRRGAGQPAIANAAAIRTHLAALRTSPLFLPNIAQSRSMALPTEGKLPDMPAFSDRAFDGWFEAQAHGALLYGLGAYGERRSVYKTPQFADAGSPERRTVHLGIDVFAPAMTPVYAPIAGTVLYVTYNADPLDFGHTLILQHDADDIPFYSLYGHLAKTLPDLLRVGDTVAPGQHIAHLGDWHENGGWAAHVHFQIMSTMLQQNGGFFFAVGHESLLDVWSDIVLDPNLALKIPTNRFV